MSGVGLLLLNAMMAAWPVDGWDLGWTPVVGPDDVLTSPEWADEAITYNLALKLRASYGASLDEDVIARFRESGKGWQGRMNEALRKAAGL